MFDSKWEEYFDDRLIKRANGYVLIKPKDAEEAIPLACPVCDMLMSSRADIDSYKSKKCCEKCGFRWADRDLERWNKGWRPSREEIQEEVRVRQLIPVSINVEFED
jgi:hypothetical protein